MFGLSLCNIGLPDFISISGLQILGPDNVAIVRLRSATILLSTGYAFFVIVYLGANPGIFGINFAKQSFGRKAKSFRAVFFILE
jgi:hypothetical protein